MATSIDDLAYVPLGALLMAREVVPELIERFARRGRDASEQSQQALRNQAELVTSLVRATLAGVLRRGGEPAAPTSAPAPANPIARPPAPPGGGEDVIRAAQAAAARALVDRHRESVQADRDAAGALPIPDYESLSAAQVNARLGALTRDELAAVEAYESSRRRRRTVLGRIEALLSEGAHVEP